MVVYFLPTRDSIKVLAERVDLGGDFYVSPGKMYVQLAEEPIVVPVVIRNRGEGPEEFSVALMQPLGLTPGYGEWDGSYEVLFEEQVRIRSGRSVEFAVTLSKTAPAGKQEIWLVVGEPKERDLLSPSHELVVRFLVSG